jgi:DNA-binding MarR family transcriptional regulator
MAPTLEIDTAQRLRMVFGRLARALRPTEAGIAAELTPTRVAVLLTTVSQGPVRLAQVAEAEGLNPTLLSRTVANLADAGLLTRTPDPVDRRSAWLEATDQGRDLAEAIRAQRTHAVEAALAALPQDDRAKIESALPALERLALHLKESRHQ